jgi:hypothetical protein
LAAQHHDEPGGGRRQGNAENTAQPDHPGSRLGQQTSKPGHHQTAIQTLPLTVGLPQAKVVVLDALRKQRNLSDYSDDLARTIDAEIRRIIEEAHQRARDILVEHRTDLETLSQILLRRETIERPEFLAILAGEPEDEVFAERDAKAAELARSLTPPPRRPPSPAFLPQARSPCPRVGARRAAAPLTRCLV